MVAVRPLNLTIATRENKHHSKLKQIQIYFADDADYTNLNCNIYSILQMKRNIETKWKKR